MNEFKNRSKKITTDNEEKTETPVFHNTLFTETAEIPNAKPENVTEEEIPTAKPEDVVDNLVNDIKEVLEKHNAETPKAEAEDSEPAEPVEMPSEITAPILIEKTEEWVQPDEGEEPFDLMRELKRILVPNTKSTDCKTLVSYATTNGSSKNIILDVLPRYVYEAWELYKKHVPDAKPGMFLQIAFDILSVKDRFMFESVGTVILK